MRFIWELSVKDGTILFIFMRKVRFDTNLCIQLAFSFEWGVEYDKMYLNDAGYEIP